MKAKTMTNPKVNKHPFMEELAKLLFGIETVSPKEQKKMVRRACKEATKIYDKDINDAAKNAINELQTMRWNAEQEVWIQMSDDFICKKHKKYLSAKWKCCVCQAFKKQPCICKQRK